MPEWCGFAVNVDAGKAMNPDVWEATLIKGDKWRFNVCRLPFLFKSETASGGVPAYTFAAIDAILAKMEAHGVKAVLDYHCLNQYPNNPKVGSQELIDVWLILIRHYLNNKNIVGVEICNEPDPSLWATGITTTAQKWAAMVKLINAIRTVNPTIPIVIPPSSFWGDSTIPVTVPPNCILAIHPYDYGSDPSWTALKKIADWRIAKAKVYAPLFSGVWCSEFEGHKRVTGITPAQEQQYVVYIINACNSEKWGFSLWKYNNATDDGGLNQDVVLGATNYVIPQPPDPCQPYKNQITSLELIVQKQLDAIEILNDKVLALDEEVETLKEKVNSQEALMQGLASQIQVQESVIGGLKGKMDSARSTLTY